MIFRTGLWLTKMGSELVCSGARLIEENDNFLCLAPVRFLHESKCMCYHW